MRVDVLAMDGRRPITGLTAADFELRDNGVVQDIQLVDTQGLPLGIVCALDASDSVAGPVLDDLTLAATALVDNLHRDDTVALLAFATRVHLLAPFTHDADRVRASIAALKPAGRTALRNAAFAAFALREQTPSRPLILLFSDGQDTVSWLSREDVRAAAARSDAVFYGVVSERSGGGAHVPFLRDVASGTGGRVLMASASLQSTFAAILDEFRTRYVLTYVPRIGRPGGIPSRFA